MYTSLFSCAMHMLNTSLTFFPSKLDSPAIKTLERIRFSSNQNIGEGESNFDEINVKEVFNLCSTEESCIHIGITCYIREPLQYVLLYGLEFDHGPNDPSPYIT